MSDLIDTTEMYLKTIYELIEDGIPALRARIVERLEQSGPTVSETVARLERDGLLTVHSDRRLELSQEGMRKATAVMRKHRIAELFLTDVLKVPIEEAHEEACRWEHVLSVDVEERMAAMMGDPQKDPFGNQIPCFECTEVNVLKAGLDGLKPLDEAKGSVEIVRMGEFIQLDAANIKELFAAGIKPGAKVTVEQESGTVKVDGGEVSIPASVARHIFCRAL